MWTVMVAFILICGYKYIDSHVPSKLELQKAQGWNAYFQVALKGCEFFVVGFIFASLLELFLYILMLFLNTPFYLGAKYEPFSFATDINNCRLWTISFFSWLVFLFSILVSVAQASKAKQEIVTTGKQEEIIQLAAEKNPIDKLLLESLLSTLMVSITLKSRKVYIGMIDKTKFFNIYTNSSPVISIIPFLSGYRDKDTLSFVLDCNYASIYQEKGISFDTKPLSYEQFRHIIPMDQIECFSLFDVDIYKAFTESN
ncbi:hypothetical protein B6D23_05395 [Gilliamella sp. N-W3]|uniref:hypothetical protein n=1 Tax=Gilliamella sp. N-W3 TaxID=1970474 RepID=UPI000A352945|nr:hypothetical protein [Gilliamella sp. N-W3]OTQ79469.1 hypothetical protein B6D23_05395 [Gilliamella sp. N-W3]